MDQEVYISQFERRMPVQTDMARMRGPVALFNMNGARQPAPQRAALDPTQDNLSMPYADQEPPVRQPVTFDVQHLGSFTLNHSEPPRAYVEEPLLGDFTD